LECCEQDPFKGRVRRRADRVEHADHGGDAAFRCTKCASTSACRPLTVCSAGAWKWYRTSW
jgi:hypothetical protein